MNIAFKQLSMTLNIICIHYMKKSRYDKDKDYFFVTDLSKLSVDLTCSGTKRLGIGLTKLHKQLDM